MTTLVVGASGSTGRLLVQQLLDQGEHVKIIVRSIASLPEQIKQNDHLHITEASILDMTDEELQEQVKDCRAVASCLGHNLTLKGMFGHPRRLVTEVAQRLSQSIIQIESDVPVKFVLMNTTGNVNKQAGETISKRQSTVLFLIRHLVPPHADNEQAAFYLQSNTGNNYKLMEWAAVRPDSLVDHESVTKYNVHPSPIRSALFDAGKTSRINVAHFMSQLILDEDMWKKWKGQMPVIYNLENL